MADEAVRAALVRFCSPGWQGQPIPSVDPRDADVKLLCDAGLAAIGHVKAGHGQPSDDRLLLTFAGYAAAEKLDADRCALSGAGRG